MFTLLLFHVRYIAAFLHEYVSDGKLTISGQVFYCRLSPLIDRDIPSRVVSIGLTWNNYDVVWWSFYLVSNYVSFSPILVVICPKDRQIYDTVFIYTALKYTIDCSLSAYRNSLACLYGIICKRLFWFYLTVLWYSYWLFNSHVTWIFFKFNQFMTIEQRYNTFAFIDLGLNWYSLQNLFFWTIPNPEEYARSICVWLW